MTYGNTQKLASTQKRIAKARRALLAERLSTSSTYCPESLGRAIEWSDERVAMLRVWDRLERAGLVRMNQEPDTDSSVDDLAGDTFNDSHADSIPGGMRALKAQRKEFLRKVETYGAIGLVGEYRIDEDSPWIQGDSLWSIEGWISESEARECFADLYESTIEALREAIRERNARIEVSRAMERKEVERAEAISEHCKWINLLLLGSCYRIEADGSKVSIRFEGEAL